MGCCASVDAQNTRVSNRPDPPGRLNKVRRVSENFHPTDSMWSFHKTIMRGVTKIPKPDEIDFVVCLSEKSLPVAILPLQFENGENSSIALPVIAIASYNEGRVVAAGSIEMFLECKQENAEYLAFLENILHFAAGMRPPSPIVYMLDMDQGDASIIHKNMNGLGFVVEHGSSVDELQKYAVVITSLNSDHGEVLLNYVRKGGGLICCSENDGNYRMNKWISRSGVAFPKAHITSHTTQKSSIRTLKPYELERSTFPFLVHTYRDILSNENPDLNDLINVISYLRYHILSIDHNENPYLTEIIDISFDYLRRTNYEQPEGIFYSKTQEIIAVLLSDAICQGSPDNFKDLILPDHFTSKMSQPSLLDEIEIRITMQVPSWHSTGLYLAPGVIATVICGNFEDDISIQIGCHSESLLESPGPWKRWPVVVISYKMETTDFEISSPYGGLIYIVNEKFDKPKTIQMKFRNVCYYPFYTDKDRWESSKNSETPWAEIQSKYITFSLPSEFVRNKTDLDIFTSTIDGMIKEIVYFTGYHSKRRFRAVFDSDQPKTGSTSSYPIMLNCSAVEPIFNITQPSSDLFSLIMMLSIVSLPENALDPNVEAAFGTLIAAHVFIKNWGNISPFDFVYEHTSPIFKELWDIYSHNDRKLIPTALMRFHQYFLTEHSSFEDSIKFIVDEMTSITEKDFSVFLNEALNPTAGELQYPDYIPADEEEEGE